LFKLAEKIVKKKLDKREADKKERVDIKLPLDIRIGSKITLDETPFLLADGLQIESPGAINFVEAFGEFTIEGVEVYRFYLKSEDDQESCLQITWDPKVKEIADCRLLRLLAELFPNPDPSDPNDRDPNEYYWSEWIGSKGYIRDDNFEANEIPYYRVWDSNGPKYTIPHSFTETIYCDEYGEEKSTSRIEAMLFGRYLDEKEEAAEFCYVQSVADTEGKSIQVIMAVDIFPASLEIL
jgi:hypothetical protein